MNHYPTNENLSSVVCTWTWWRKCWSKLPKGSWLSISPDSLIRHQQTCKRGGNLNIYKAKGCRLCMHPHVDMPSLVCWGGKQGDTSLRGELNCKGLLNTVLWPRGLVLHSPVMFCKCLLVPMDISWACVNLPPLLIPFSPSALNPSPPSVLNYFSLNLFLISLAACWQWL